MSETRKPKVIVGTLIYNADGKIRLGKSTKWNGQWIFPGGHVERWEGLEQTVRREVKEETNLEVEDIEFLKFEELIFSKEFHDKERHMISFVYSMKAVIGNVIANDEFQERWWFDIDEIQSINIYQGCISIIELWKQKYFLE